MKRWLTFLFVATLAVGVSAVVNRAPEALARMEMFRVTGVEYPGGRYISEAEAREFLSLPPGASVWDDVEALEARLMTHPLVEDARVRRRFPGTLVLEIREREPVALYPNPTLEPVDQAGRLLPIDPALHRLDLPLIASGEMNGPEGLTPLQRRLLAQEISRIQSSDPEFLSRISEITLGYRRDLRASVWNPPLTLDFRPGISSQRIREALRVLDDAAARYPDAEVVGLDLRYDDQVVIRMNRVEGN